MEWTLQHIILLFVVIHLILHTGKTAGNRAMKFLFPQLIPTPLRSSIEERQNGA